MKFEVGVTRTTTYAIDAKDEKEAIDRVIEGHGKEVGQETHTAFIWVNP